MVLEMISSRTGSRTDVINLSHVTFGHAQWEFPGKQRSSAEEIQTQQKFIFSKFLLHFEK